MNSVKRPLSLLLTVIMILTVVVIAPATKAEAAGAGYELVWHDEFDGNSLNTSYWTAEIGTGEGGWGNNEWEYYTDRSKNVRVANGELVITAHKEEYGGMHYTSARLKTKDKVSFQYGYIEGRMKLPTGQGIWPAFWMLGANINEVPWPACGEIDIHEYINTESLVHGTVHWHNNGYVYSGTGSQEIDVTQYHVYAIEWTPEHIYWYCDGIQYYQVDLTAKDLDAEEYHRPFFILLNLAVGGNWPGYPNDSTRFPAQVNVDYVRVYQKPGSRMLTGTVIQDYTAFANGSYYLVANSSSKVVCADNYGADPLIANRESYGGDWEGFTLINNADSTISLRSNYNSKYMSVGSDSKLYVSASNIGSREKFVITPNRWGYSLRSVATGKYICADRNIGDLLICNRDKGEDWESFKIYPTNPSAQNPTPTYTINNGNYCLTDSQGLVVCADNYAADPLTANRTEYGGDWEGFELVNNSDGTVSLRSHYNSLYVSVAGDSKLYASANSIGANEKFYVAAKGNGFTLRSKATGLYVSADQNIGSVLICNRESTDNWETLRFTGVSPATTTPTAPPAPVGLSNGNYYFVASNSKVISADNYGKDPLIANRDSYGGDWEMLTVINNADGTISLRSGYNGKYVCMVNNDDCQLVARSAAIDDWEKFTLVPVSGNQYALYSAVNNKFVCADQNRDGVLFCDRDSVGDWETFTVFAVN